MDAEKWLKRGWELNKEIEELKTTKINMWERCTRVTPTYSTEPGGGSPNTHKFDNLAAFGADIDARCAELAEVSREIFNAICQLPLDAENNNYRRLLQYRYLNFYTFEEIAVMMHYSWRHIHRLHKEALRAIERVIECHID